MKLNRRKFFGMFAKGTAIAVAAPVLINELLKEDNNSVWSDETLQALKDRRDYLREHPVKESECFQENTVTVDPNDIKDGDTITINGKTWYAKQVLAKRKEFEKMYDLKILNIT